MEQLIQFATIGGTLGLLWLTLQAIRRLRGTNAPVTRVRVHQRITLANGCQLVVLEWDGKELLVTTGSQPCAVVASRVVKDADEQQEASGAWAG